MLCKHTYKYVITIFMKSNEKEMKYGLLSKMRQALHATVEHLVHQHTHTHTHTSLLLCVITITFCFSLQKTLLVKCVHCTVIAVLSGLNGYLQAM